MVQIPGYSQGLVRIGQVANSVNPQAIGDAAAGFNAIAQSADMAAQVSQRIEEEAVVRPAAMLPAVAVPTPAETRVEAKRVSIPIPYPTRRNSRQTPIFSLYPLW